MTRRAAGSLGPVCLVAALAFGAAQGGRVRLLDWTAPVPAGWTATPSTSGMRLAQFEVRGASGAGAAEAVVYYFGPGGGGSIDANIQRWTSQFAGADGGAVRPVIGRLKAGALPVTTVELRGTYARGVGTGPSGAALPDHTLLAYVVETPKGNLTFQLWGPATTVAAHRADLDRMVLGLTAG
ncbi:MAG: hypothetical protein AB7O28_09575 [Vicinamibacterales bacterium]